MSVPANADDLTPAVELILQPLVLETLAAVDEGKALEDALPVDADSALLAAAVHRLTTVGAIDPSPDGPLGRHQLTNRGRALLGLLERLTAAMTAAEPAGPRPNASHRRTPSTAH